MKTSHARILGLVSCMMTLLFFVTLNENDKNSVLYHVENSCAEKPVTRTSTRINKTFQEQLFGFSTSTLANVEEPILLEGGVSYVEPVCKPHTNIAFLKVHKAGSSTIMNMFYRFAEKNDLNLVLPNATEGTYNYLGYGRTLSVNKLVKLPTGASFNILCNHVIYNREAFLSVMPKDTYFIGILRDPVPNFVSAFLYYGAAKFFHSKLYPNVQGEVPPVHLMQEFLKNPEQYENEGFVYYIRNKMSFDFGLTQDKFNDERAISEFIAELDNDFVLVLILEYLDESLVLMKRILCWELKDIVYLPANVRPPSVAANIVDFNLGNYSQKRLAEYNNADFMLYQYFKRRLFSQIEEMDSNFKLEVEHFKKVQFDISQNCIRFHHPVITIPASPWNEEFKVTEDDCLRMMTEELVLVKEQIMKALDKYDHWLKHHKS